MRASQHAMFCYDKAPCSAASAFNHHQFNFRVQMAPVGLACDLRICSAFRCHLSALIRRIRRWLTWRVSSSTDRADLSIWLRVATGRRAAAAAAWWPCMAMRTEASWPRAMVSTEPCEEGTGTGSPRSQCLACCKTWRIQAGGVTPPWGHFPVCCFQSSTFRLLLGAEAAVMTPNGVDFSVLSLQA